MICPTCGEVSANEVAGVEIPGIYDGILFWVHPVCDTAFHRFDTDYMIHKAQRFVDRHNAKETP